MTRSVWILFAAAAALAAGCGRHAPERQSGVGSDGRARRVNVGELVSKEPAHYVGQKVTVEGPVANVLSESALAIGTEGAGGGRGLLVLVPNRAQELPQRGRVTVTGTVIRYDRDQLRREYGAVAITPEIDARYGGQVAVVADSLRGPDGREVAAAARNAPLPAGTGEYPGTDHDRQQPGGTGSRYVGPRDRQPRGLPAGSGSDRP